jgi:hypothetical protein
VQAPNNACSVLTLLKSEVVITINVYNRHTFLSQPRTKAFLTTTPAIAAFLGGKIQQLISTTHTDFTQGACTPGTIQKRINHAAYHFSLSD